MVPMMRGLPVPVTADSIDSPIVSYGEGPVSVQFATSDSRWARLTFEKLDSLRISRGEYDPYPSDWVEGDPVHWVSVVTASHWLHERYDYEKEHYGHAYEFCGDVEEMRREFSHYVFSFHDQYVEALAAGIWIETGDEYLGAREPREDHPLLDLPVSAQPESFTAHGIVCQVRRNPRPLEALLKDAELCSQKLLQFAAELEGSTSVSWTLDLRVRDGAATSRLRSYFGHVDKAFDGIATIEAVRPRVEKWLGEVHERRRAMGKN